MALLLLRDFRRENQTDVQTASIERTTYRKMAQNLVWATGYNLFAIPLAAGVLYNYALY